MLDQERERENTGEGDTQELSPEKFHYTQTIVKLGGCQVDTEWMEIVIPI